VAKDLVVPENIRLLRLPAYAPELNPQEHVWDEVREKEFPNRVFSDLASVTVQLERGLPQLAADHERLRSITAWPWIVSLILNANYNKRRAKFCKTIPLASQKQRKRLGTGGLGEKRRTC
jgi:hypothetical protein